MIADKIKNARTILYYITRKVLANCEYFANEIEKNH